MILLFPFVVSAFISLDGCVKSIHAGVAVGPMFDLKYSVYMIIIKGFIDVSFVFINNGKIWILIAKLWSLVDNM